MDNIVKNLKTEEIRANDSDKVPGSVVACIEKNQIIAELCNDFSELDHSELVKIINRYNEIIVEMLTEGHKVNTGLFNIKTIIKDPTVLKEHLQNSSIAITKGSIDITKPNAKTSISITHSANISKQENTIRTRGKNLMNNGEPACGIAFRQWLCKA
jgi:hypothetical protein